MALARLKALSCFNKSIFHTCIRANSSFSKLYRDKWPEKIPVEFIDYVSDKYNLNIKDNAIEDYQTLTGNMRNNWKIVDDIFKEYQDEIYPSFPDRPYQTVQAGSPQNKFGEWTVKCEIKPTNPDGPLKSYESYVKFYTLCLLSYV